MPPIYPQLFSGASARSGFSIAVSELRAGQFIRIGITALAQEKRFGGVLRPQSDALVLRLSSEPKDNHILQVILAELDEPNALPLAGGIKGSISLKLTPWRQIATGKRPAKELPVVGGQASKSVLLKLPEWARPELIKIGQGKSIMEG
ncbi:MAG: hypothetical protein GYB53_18395 [Rhodobacteraceae bacterium]|nr:hypothetical protein [Paracoccaceae bacterium]MBR9819382.1 hypothetical protein [Paracoccaceae bacterium]